VDEVVEREGVARAIGIKHVASLLYTYRCTIACRHCLFSCSPAQPPLHASLEDGLEFLEQLHATDRVVHVAGGEAMIFYDELIELWRRADARGIAPHFLETNASWCTSDGLAIERFGELRDAGAGGVLISCDPYHLAQVDARAYLRARKHAIDAFGPENVITSTATPAEIERIAAIGQSEVLLREYVREHPPRLVGRAGENLAGLLPGRPVRELAFDELWHPVARRDGTCISEFDPGEMWEIHIDPYGNVQTCCGIILGNAREEPLPAIMKDGFNSNEVVSMVREKGPFGLLDMAIDLGYQARDGYPQKCNLCWEVRKFLRPRFPEALGPNEVYGPIDPAGGKRHER
jgi:hypothetical protein